MGWLTIRMHMVSWLSPTFKSFPFKSRIPLAPATPTNLILRCHLWGDMQQAHPSNQQSFALLIFTHSSDISSEHNHALQVKSNTNLRDRF